MSESCAYPNKQARIVTVDEGRVRATKTTGRDSGFSAIVASELHGKTKLAVLSPDGTSSLEMGGHAARTLYRLLHRHYSQTGKPLGFRTPSGEGGCECSR